MHCKEIVPCSKLLFYLTLIFMMSASTFAFDYLFNPYEVTIHERSGGMIKIKWKEKELFCADVALYEQTHNIIDEARRNNRPLLFKERVLKKKFDRKNPCRSLSKIDELICVDSMCYLPSFWMEILEFDPNNNSLFFKLGEGRVKITVTENFSEKLIFLTSKKHHCVFYANINAFEDVAMQDSLPLSEIVTAWPWSKANHSTWPKWARDFVFLTLVWQRFHMRKTLHTWLPRKLLFQIFERLMLDD